MYQSRLLSGQRSAQSVGSDGAQGGGRAVRGSWAGAASAWPFGARYGRRGVGNRNLDPLRFFGGKNPISFVLGLANQCAVAAQAATLLLSIELGFEPPVPVSAGAAAPRPSLNHPHPGALGLVLRPQAAGKARPSLPSEPAAPGLLGFAVPRLSCPPRYSLTGGEQHRSAAEPGRPRGRAGVLTEPVLWDQAECPWRHRQLPLPAAAVPTGAVPPLPGRESGGGRAPAAPTCRLPAAPPSRDPGGAGARLPAGGVTAGSANRARPCPSRRRPPLIGGRAGQSGGGAGVRPGRGSSEVRWRRRRPP